MSSLADTLRRQVLLSGERPGSMRWLLQDLEYSYEDEITIKSSFSGDPVPPRASQFTPDGLCGHLLAVAEEAGTVQLMDTRKPLINALISEIDCHSNSIFDISWLPGGTKLITASGDLTLCLWDVTCSSCLRKFNWHRNSVKSVDVNKQDDCMFVSCGRDGNVAVWDTRCSVKKSGLLTPANCIHNAHMLPSARKTPPPKGRAKKSCTGPPSSVTSVVFLGGNKVASAGAADGLVKVWDLRKNYSSFKSQNPRPYLTFEPSRQGAGCSSLVVDSNSAFLYATSTHGYIYKYCTNGAITKPVEMFGGGGFEATSFYVKSCLSPDNQFLLSGSTAGKGFIWEVERPEAPPLVLPMVSKEVTCVAWCPASLDKVALCIEENGLSVWRGRRGRKTGDREEDVTITRCRESTGTRKRLHSIENVFNQSSSLCQKRLKFSRTDESFSTLESPPPPSSSE